VLLLQLRLVELQLLLLLVLQLRLLRHQLLLLLVLLWQHFQLQI
jgi:hypothetical protein